MKNYILYFLALSLTYSTLNAQNWKWAKQATSSNASSEGIDVCNDFRGNVYITGCYYDNNITFGNTTLYNTSLLFTLDIFIAKYDSNGNALWAKNIGGSSNDIVKSIYTDKDGNIIVTGYYWSNYLTIDTIILTNNSNNFDVFVAKYNASGDLLWAKNAGGLNKELSNSIATDSKNNIYITGCFNSSIFSIDNTSISNVDTSYDFLIIKLSPDGNVIWLKSINMNVGNLGSITIDKVDNIYISGSFTDSTINIGTNIFHNLDTNYVEMFIAKFDTNGNNIWAKKANGKYHDYYNDMVVDSVGNLYATGGSNSPILTIDNISIINSDTTLKMNNFFIVKYDTSGNIFWIRKSIDSVYSEGWSVSTDNSGSVYVSGSFLHEFNIVGSIDTLFQNSNSYDPIFLIKYDNIGNVECFESLSSGGDDMNSISCDLYGNVYITGDYYGTYISIGNTTLQINSNVISPLNEYETIFLAKYNCSYPQNFMNYEQNNIITVFPNPTSNDIIIESKVNKLKSVKVMNFFGDIIKQYKINYYKEIIHLNDLNSGIYLLEITDENSKLFYKKIVLQ